MMMRLKRTTALAAVATLSLATAAHAGCGAGHDTHAMGAADPATIGATIGATTASMTGAPAAATAEKATIGVEDEATAPATHAGRAADDAGLSTTDKAQTDKAQSAIDAKPTASDLTASDARTGHTAIEPRSAEADTGSKAEATSEAMKGPVTDTTNAGQPTRADATTDTAASADAGEDLLIATVGDHEIRRSDVLGAIRMLPPQLQQQPPEMLVPMALDQLVLRELILREAVEAGFETDASVTALGTDASETEREDTMVQAWLDRELEGAVTDGRVAEAYGAISAELGEQAPALDEIRPQLENELRRRAFNDISTGLQADADITVFGADGQPMTR